MDVASTAIDPLKHWIRSGKPGGQQFLALFETTCPGTDQRPSWVAAEESAADAPIRIARRRDVGADSYWLEFALHSP
jgi:hypothetical protein